MNTCKVYIYTIKAQQIYQRNRNIEFDKWFSIGMMYLWIHITKASSIFIEYKDGIVLYRDWPICLMDKIIIIIYVILTILKLLVLYNIRHIW